jgi:CheY-like chemotaxis protein
MKEFRDLHIVLAEDDPDDAEILCTSFTNHPSIGKVDWVKNGQMLLDFLKNSIDKKPDIILTDINMPIVNGIQALEEIFKDSQLSSIPVFVYSTTVNPLYETKCKELGAWGYLIKPYKLSDFEEIPYQIIYILKKNWEQKNNPVIE